MPRANKLSDSPWYWAYLFCTAGLIALVLIGPKFAARQAQVERKYQGRQRAAQQSAGQEPNTPLSSTGSTAITLAPLIALLAAGVLVCWVQLWRTRFARRGSRRGEGAAT